MPASLPIADIELRDVDGEPSRLSDVLARRYTVVQLVRYYGCLPCQDWLIRLDNAMPLLGRHDAGAIAVGGSADYQAQWLRDERGVEIPLFLDPDHQLREALGTRKGLGVRMLDPRGFAAYGKVLRSGLKPQGITKDSVRSPGVVILDQERQVHWQYTGNRIGDYPPVDEVIRAVRELT